MIVLDMNLTTLLTVASDLVLCVGETGNHDSFALILKSFPHFLFLIPLNFCTSTPFCVFLLSVWFLDHSTPLVALHVDFWVFAHSFYKYVTLYQIQMNRFSIARLLQLQYCILLNTSFYKTWQSTFYLIIDSVEIYQI